MESPRLHKGKFFFTIFIVSIVTITSYGCFSPKVYFKSYSDQKFNPNEIKKLAVVLDDTRLAENYVFSKLFTQTAIERKKFFLVYEESIAKDQISNEVKQNVDAFLSIGLTHIYHGNTSTYLPTSIGAYANLIEPKSGRMLWSANYSYSSEITGLDAPSIEEVMIIVSTKLIDSIPLEYFTPPPLAKKTENVPKEIVAKKNDVQQVVNPIQIKPDHVNTSAKNDFAQISLNVHNATLKLSIEGNIYREPDGSKINGANLEIIQKETKEPMTGDTLPKGANTLKGKYYSVQVGAFRTREYAERRISFLKEKGYANVIMLPVADSKGRRWHTIRIGRFSSSEEAQKIASDISDKVKLKTAIRPVGMP